MSEVVKRSSLSKDVLTQKSLATATVLYNPEEKKEKGEKQQISWSKVREKALARALGGGTAGAMAMMGQVLSLMWLRTTMNYQYRNGTSTTAAIKHLYKEGGVRRFYRGVGPALIQGPMARFFDTAANTGVQEFFNARTETENLPTSIKTVTASLTTASCRILLMPVDTTKTIMQVEGKDGFKKLITKAKTSGPRIFFHGSLATCSASFVGHYPWFYTYNKLNEILPVYDDLLKKLLRNATMGFCATVVSDSCSNSIRVVKTTKQTCVTAITYPQAVKLVVEKDGLIGLFGRGLKTRILANGLQGMMFAVLWRFIDDAFFKKK
eukprot:CAMPEP_0174252526 /NCGR_PEP_ID=MMETSP0439-20130205/1961_1 /TAXON_ID=0 /ORGANISM="Stereomyxa ramosa, Strain Chinc5" /LENGTH=322 /DNA_ID=CAMNT_0015333077 /DNA_START=23 /DNA_END=991 /DNA_ORIENTATION=-